MTLLLFEDKKQKPAEFRTFGVKKKRRGGVEVITEPRYMLHETGGEDKPVNSLQGQPITSQWGGGHRPSPSIRPA